MRKILFFGFLFLSLHSVAQPDRPTNPVPLDGGLSLLILAGCVAGYKAIKNNENK